MGYCSTNILDEDSIDFLLKSAMENCEVLNDEDPQFIYCDVNNKNLYFSQVTDAYAKNTYKSFSELGLKLEKAMSAFPIDLNNLVCADIGASTGGFTDCMLQNGAKKVYAIDVGYGQLAWKLRTDERVVNLERTNFRYVDNTVITEPLDFASVDVSFISLKHILPNMKVLLKKGATAVCLIKPQFEAGKEKVGKKGVVRDSAVHIEVIDNVTNYITENGFSLLALDYSPIKGPEGNIEYLAYIRSDDAPTVSADISAEETVKLSHNSL
jgi:23S rRNA (cytidine1920-2'-O)/16S rRNA (cytidine1409-2'-O)-methyltransferase